jgi:hypothetical protein
MMNWLQQDMFRSFMSVSPSALYHSLVNGKFMFYCRSQIMSKVTDIEFRNVNLKPIIYSQLINR